MLKMKSKPNNSVPFVLALLVASLFIRGIGEAEALATPPFAGLAGKWSGDGYSAKTDGTTQRLRCDADYVVGGGGDNLESTLRCHSDSYDLNLRFSLASEAGNILGNWSETSQNVQGGISGRASVGLIQATLRGQAFAAAVTVVTRRTEQSVKIRTQSGALSQVTITLHHDH